MTYQIVYKPTGEVIDVANTWEEAEYKADFWNAGDPEGPYQWREVREDGDRPVPTATA